MGDGCEGGGGGGECDKWVERAEALALRAWVELVVGIALIRFRFHAFLPVPLRFPPRLILSASPYLLSCVHVPHFPTSTASGEKEPSSQVSIAADRRVTTAPVAPILQHPRCNRCCFPTPATMHVPIHLRPAGRRCVRMLLGPMSRRSATAMSAYIKATGSYTVLGECSSSAPRSRSLRRHSSTLRLRVRSVLGVLWSTRSRGLVFRTVNGLAIAASPFTPVAAIKPSPPNSVGPCGHSYPFPHLLPDHLPILVIASHLCNPPA